MKQLIGLLPEQMLTNNNAIMEPISNKIQYLLTEINKPNTVSLSQLNIPPTVCIYY